MERSRATRTTLAARIVVAGVTLSVPVMLAQNPAARPFPAFVDIAARAGVTVPLVSGRAARAQIIEMMSGGVALVDYDNDGWLDIYVTNGSTIAAELKGANPARDRLYRNLHTNTFADVTTKSGLGDTAWTMGVCAGDVDNNGFDDLLVANYGRNALYLNKGDGTFRNASAGSGLAVRAAWHSACAFADYDRDGDLDVYISAYVQFDVRKLPPPPLHESMYPTPVGMPATRHQLFENRGAGRFVDVTESSKVGAADPYYGLGVVWVDYDNDGDQDIYVANDQTPNYLFRNEGNRTFTEVGIPAGVALTPMGQGQASMGADAADIDNDGDFDLLVTNFDVEYDSVYRNQGGGRFSDYSFESGIGNPTIGPMGWGTRFVDLDLDGLLDLVTINGHLTPKADNMGVGDIKPPGYRQRPLVFRASRSGVFEEISASVKGLQDLRVGRGLAVGDINNDGQMDLVTRPLDGTPGVLLNQGVPGNWLLVKLRGTKSNRSAVGARVWVTTGGRTQLREVQAGGSYLSMHDLRLHYGLGPNATVDTLRIRWPDGREETRKGVKANQILTIDESR